MQRSPRRMNEYAATVGARLDAITAMDGKQPGDPERAARLFPRLATMDDWEQEARSVDYSDAAP